MNTILFVLDILSFPTTLSILFWEDFFRAIKFSTFGEIMMTMSFGIVISIFGLITSPFYLLYCLVDRLDAKSY